MTTTASIGIGYIISSLMGTAGPPSLENLYFDAAIWAAVISPTEQLFVKDWIASWGDPGMSEMDPDGEFISNQKTATIKSEANPLEYRLISAYGFPSPDGKTIKDLNALKGVPLLGAIYTPFQSGFWQLSSTQAKLESVIMAALVGGGTFTKDGSFLTDKESSKGEGIEIFKSNTKRYEYKFYNQELDKFLNETVPETLAAVTLIHAFNGFNPGMNIIYLGPIMATGTGLVTHLKSNEDEIFYNAWAHGNILEKIQKGSPSIIEQTIDDTPTLGGKTTTTQVSSNISASSVNTSTAGFSAPDQAFVLLSNLDKNGNSIDTYHAITIEAFTEGSSDQSDAFPIEIDGQKKWVTLITVKEAPTAVKGVVNTFLPKKLKEFKYSENFSAWKDVGSVDEWGNFTIKDLKLAEGQNVLAFDAESWIGNKNNQQLNIVLNTIPLQPSNAYPSDATAGTKPEIGVEFNKANYSADAAEKIDLLSFQVDGQEILDKAVVNKQQADYKSTTTAKYTPVASLTEGEHSVAVKAESNVGVSQALWNFTVDTTAPTISLDSIEAYSARAPDGSSLCIKYQTADNSAYLKNISVRLYRGTEPNEDTNFVSEITQVATQAAGEHFVNWNGKDASGNVLEDGTYTVRIKAFDQAGNWSAAEKALILDSAAPQINSANVSPNPVTSNNSEFTFSGQFTEKATVIISMTNQSTGKVTAYLTSTQSSVSGSGYPASYIWSYTDTFIPVPEDGIYKFEISARDAAGNESSIYSIENFKIDRTPPVIYAQYADPYALANSGNSAYQTTLRYSLSESNDVEGNKGALSQVVVKLYDENSGEMLWSKEGGSSLTNENSLLWDASATSIVKGAYKFQVAAYDAAGNYSTAYAICVKDGIAPVISYPAENQEVSGTVVIRGTAMDPDWTNSQPFKQYRVYYAEGRKSSVVSPGSDWKTDAIEVPEIYRDPASGIRNQSINAVQNDTTLAYFYTDSLTNGEYTLLVVAEEEGDGVFAAAQTVSVKNDAFTASANPSIKIGDIPSDITFDGTNSLPISFSYSGKEINAYVEIMQINAAGSRETVYYQYYPNLVAAYYTGQPTYNSGNELGYFVWQDENGWHVRWNGEAGKEHRFNGSLIVAGSLSEVKMVSDGITQLSSNINWDQTMSGGEGGFDFKTDAEQIIFSSWIDNDPSNYNDEFNTTVNPYFGQAKQPAASSPVIISGITAQTSAASQALNWNGKLDSGAYVDSGNYVVQVRAEGTDGAGLTVVEKNLTVKTPFELSNLSVSSASFNPVGLPDRVTVSYNISKDAQIKLKVYPSGSSTPLAIIDGGIQLGKTNTAFPHSISWRGNFPDENGTQVVTSGDYVLKVAATAADGTETIEKDVESNVKIESLGASAAVKLDPIGEQINYNGGTVQAAEGSSGYFWEAKASGFYYPPLNYNFTLGLAGKQKASVYPYVPFAGILHRSFRKADVKFKVYLRVFAHDYKKNWLLQWEEKNKDFDLVLEGEKSFINGGEPFEKTYYVRADDHWERGDAGLTKPGAVTGAEIRKIEVLAQRYPYFSLDTADNITIAENSVYQSFGKGIFVAQNAGQKNGDDYSLAVRIRFPDESDLNYSRLTNRFVPWYGFVNANHSSYESFASVNQYLSKLGFPGEDYFNDAAKTLADYQKEIIGSYDISIFDPNTYLSGGNIVKSVLEEKTSSGAKGDTTIDAQNAYLSDEYVEFIPITAPQEGSFDYLGAILDKEEDVDGDGNKEIILKNSLTAYPIEAVTAYRIPYSAANSQLIEISWPNDWTAINAKNQELLAPLAGLNQDPQTYNIANTALEIDTDELRSREADGSISGANISGILRYDKNQIPAQYYAGLNALGGYLPVPDYVTTYTYSIVGKSPSDLALSFDSGSQNSTLKLSISRTEQNWSSEDEPILKNYGGVIKSSMEVFNAEGFSADGKSVQHYFWDVYKNNYARYQNYDSADYNQYLFWTGDPLNIYQPDASKGNLIENPNLVINDWQITLKDESGAVNEDINVEAADIHANYSSLLEHYFQAKLNYYAKERKIVALSGQADSDYEVMYFDGTSWINVVKGAPTGGYFTSFWDVGRLCGKYSVLLKTASAIDSQDVYIGDPVYHGVDTTDNNRVTSAYKRAELAFQSNSFMQDEFSSVTPVTQDEIEINNRPILVTHGPIVELKPSPVTFEVGSRPFLRFMYTADDLKEGYGISVSPNDPDWKNKTDGLNVHQITANGDLQVVSDQKSYLETDTTGLPYFAFEATLDHFSDYALLNGKFTLSAPIVFADAYFTNKNTVTIYGTAEPASIVTLYEKVENITPDPSQSEPYTARMTAESASGNFEFANIALLQEGANYFWVTSHQPEDKDIRTMGSLVITKDTLPSVFTLESSTSLFSPNDDGKLDECEFTAKTNESGRIYLQLTADNPTTVGNPTVVGNSQLQKVEISAEANGEIKLTWTKAGFSLYRRSNITGQWAFDSLFALHVLLADDAYTVTAYAIDQAGNISNNIIKTITVDTVPPAVSLTQSALQFSPDGNGKYDSVEFETKSSEPGLISYTLSGQRLDGELLKFEGTVTTQANTQFKFDWDNIALTISSTEVLQSLPYYNDLKDGVFTFEVSAVDAAENRSPPATVEVSVDLTPPELINLSATPEIFSPNGDGVKDSTTIDWEFSEPVEVSLEVTGGYGRLPEVTAGYQKSNSFSWDGTVNGQSLIVDGQYQITLTAHDAVGNAYSSAQKDKNIQLTIDTTPPVCALSQSLYAFSPNGDGKYDSVDFTLRTNEDAVLQFTADAFPLFAGEVVANREIVINCNQVATLFSALATDEAGNTSIPATGEVIVDLTPPGFISIEANPNPFTPNNDGVKDTATIAYQLSEPANVVTRIYKENQETFRQYEGQTENFVYPTFQLSVVGAVSSVGSWIWDGAGAHGELMGATYNYHLYAEDWVGNCVTSEMQSLVVDRAASLVPYAFADPDPFSPVNPGNNYTEINYYLSRDNLKVKVYLVGEGEKAIKNLVLAATQNKGEHKAVWYGDYESGYDGGTAAKNKERVGDGTYQFVVYAEDPDGGQPANVSNTVLVDNTEPYLATKPIVVDYGTKKATLVYNLPENATVEVEVYSEENEHLATLITAESQWAGDYTLVYDFSPYSEGKKYFHLKAVDRAKNVSEKSTETFAVNPNEFQIASLNAFPNPFTPNGDGHTDQIKLSYAISGGVAPYNVSINILTTSGSTSKKLIANETQDSAAYSYYWDGKKDDGSYMEDGEYQFEISAEDALKSSVVNRGSLVAVSSLPLVNLTLSPAIFSPNGDGAFDTILFTSSIDYPTRYITGEALVKLEVLNGSNEALWSKTFNHTPGTYAYTYDGLSANGSSLTAGNYYVRASAQDALVTAAIPQTADLQVVYDQPAVAILYLEPNPFSPEENGIKDTTVLSYSLSKPAYVSVGIQDTNGQIVRNLVTNQLTDAYIPVASNLKGMP